ncbi:MAG: fumarate reductase/succinate dehydrogenase flavoprotein subunit, partial [Bacteroidales bacterium]|nr:fumarate reductase/succinate dehydrogenase flavoprotein subunit [Bacteroidales bacterium]
IYSQPIPTTVPEFEAAEKAVAEKIEKLMSIKGAKSVDSFQKELGHIMWNKVGMGRTAEGLKEAVPMLQALKEEFWQNVRITGDTTSMNPELEKALRLSDHIELAQLMAKDALHREESCGGHFREEHQTEEGEAKRNDEQFMYVAAWEYQGENAEPQLHKEELNYEFIKVQQRNYK